jgi:5,10-methylene-tetrahydrofolate dehydrogenase/methenyl tetrahydrofolate cyclohydrolase
MRMPAQSEAVPDVVLAPELSGASLGSAGPELAPNPTPTTDRLVLEEAAYQWEQIADITGNHYPTLAQFRGMVALASDRPAPVRDAHERPTPWDLALERFNRQEPAQTEWDDFITNHPELWRLTSQEQQHEEAPRLDIVIPDTAPDKISYALRAMAHGAAIGARVVLHGDEDVRSHERINRLLTDLGENTTVGFADPAEDAELSTHLSALHDLNRQKNSDERLIATFDWAAGGEHQEALDQFSIRFLEGWDLKLYQGLSDKITDLGKVITALQAGPQTPSAIARINHILTRPNNGIKALRQQQIELLRPARDTFAALMTTTQTKIDKLLLSRDQAIERLLGSLNANDDVNSILVLLPGSRQGEKLIRQAMTDPAKDADGINFENGVVPLTPQACIAALESFIGQELTSNLSLRMLVTGHGNLVGAPLLQLLAERGFKINIPDDAKDVPHYPEPKWQGAAEVDVLPNAKHVINYKDYVSDQEYDVVFCCARGENVFDARDFKVREGSVVIFIDAAGNVKLDTIGNDGRYAVAPPRGGVGPVTTMLLLKHAIQRKHEHILALRRAEQQERSVVNRTARALGILGRRHGTTRKRRVTENPTPAGASDSPAPEREQVPINS